MNITDTISEKISDIFKPQRKFIPVLLTTIMLMRGKVIFRNSSRYSELSGKNFSRRFRTPSDFTQFDSIGISMSVKLDTLMIAATDCSFIPESGSRTYGLAKFYNSKASEAGKGLEISELAVTDVNYNTAYTVSAWQTPDTPSSGHSRTDRYHEQFQQDVQCIPTDIRYPAADGYYAEKKSVDGVRI